MTAPLHGIRVLETATGIAGPFAGRLLAAYGAEVVKLEPPGGDPSRREAAAPGPRPDDGMGSLFAALNTDKRSVLVDGPRDPLVRELLAGADVLLHSWPAPVLEEAGLDRAARRAVAPRLVTVAVTPFGQVGPYAPWTGSDLVVYAMGGPMHATGEPSREPMKLAGHVVEYLAGAGAAFAALAALATAERGGTGVDVDISNFETQASSIDRRSVLLLGHQFTGAVGYREGGNRMSAIPAGIFPAADGYVQVVFAPNWMPRVGEMLRSEDLDAILHRGDWVDDPDLPETLHSALLAWSLARTRAECMEEAQAHRLAVMPLNSPAEVLTEPHFRARGSFVDVPRHDGRRHLAPGAPFRMDDGFRPPDPAPVLDQHGVVVRTAGWRTPTGAGRTPPAGAASGRLPLDGIRVIDLTVVWSGPYCTMHLGDLGADVIRVDNAHLFPTATRGAVPRPRGPASELGQVWGAFPDGDPGRRPWNRAGGFVCHARGKRSLTLDLRRPSGREAMLELVERSDVLVENNSAKVMDRLGLGWDVLSARNPRLVMVRMPLLGLDGPYRDHIGFGAHIEALIGLTTLRGYLDSDPTTNDPTYHMDPASGTVAAFAVLAALRRREITGAGGLVELAQAENLLQFLGEYYVDASLGRREWSALGNRHPHRAPQGVYPCTGDDRWVAVSVSGDHEWRGLVRAMGSPAWARDGDLDDEDGRRARHDELDRRLAEWTEGLDRWDVTRRCQAEGVEAGPVLDEADLLADPHLREREFFVRAGSDELGEWDFAGHLWRWDGPARRVGPVNQLGRDNEDILRDVLGWDDDRIEALRAEGHLHLDYLDADGNPY